MQYFLIALIAALTALICVLLARSGMPWFRTLRMPPWSPAGQALVWSWSVLFSLTALSAILAWNAASPEQHGQLGAVYAIHAFLNAAWCYLFFVRHQIGSAALEACLLAIAIAVIVLEVFPVSWVAVVLVLPFFVWVLFGMYLTLTIFRMNLGGRGRSEL